MASTRALAHAPWSPSKIQTALRCPRLFHYRYVDRVPEPEILSDTRVGKAIHSALESALGGTLASQATSEARTALTTPHERERYDSIARGIDPFVARIEAFMRQRNVRRSLIEYSLAIDSEFKTTSFFAKHSYFRGIFDAAYVFGDHELAIVDHKTGERREDAKMLEQLHGYVVLAAMAFRQIRRFWLGIHWVACETVNWAAPVSAAEIGQRFIPELSANIEAASLAVADGPRPESSSWCERCSYRSICPEGQRLRFEPVETSVDDEDL